MTTVLQFVLLGDGTVLVVVEALDGAAGLSVAERMATVLADELRRMRTGDVNDDCQT